MRASSVEEASTLLEKTKSKTLKIYTQSGQYHITIVESRGS